MAQKPLDAAFGASSETKKKKRGAFVAIVAVVGLAGISSVFAANVGINGGDGITFSQGTTTIAACDTDGITAALGAIYSTADSGFALDTITLTGVSADCTGLDLSLELYAGTTKLVTISGEISGTTVVLGQAGTVLPSGNATSSGIIAPDTTADEAGVSYTSGKNATHLAADADRIVIEIN